MHQAQQYISYGDIEHFGEEIMNTPTNSRVINEWLAKTNRTLTDLPESLHGLLSKGVDE